MGDPAKCDKTPLVHMLIPQPAACGIDRGILPLSRFLSIKVGDINVDNNYECIIIAVIVITIIMITIWH